MASKKAKTEEKVVTTFREYLRCKTVHPEPVYDGAVKLLLSIGEEAGLECQSFKLKTGDPVLIMKWEGTDPSLKCLLLNSHMDVVPVYMEHWKWDPFGAEKSEEGNIYARGTQDMKSVTIQYIEAIKRLRASGFQPLRNIYLTIVPDEEIGGSGMRELVTLQAFKEMNVGFTLDEGLANPEDKYTVFYGERGSVRLEITCTGDTGHGSRFIENYVGEKMQKIITSAHAFREKEKKRMETENLKLGDVSTLNLTMIQGGVAYNVVPMELKAVFDVRLSEGLSEEELKKMVEGWCADAGDGVSHEFPHLFESNITKLSNKLPWWTAFEETFNERDIEFDLEVFSAATDSRYLRMAGYPCIGFSPMKNTPILLHDHNEFINEDVFLEGIKVYEALIPALSGVPKSPIWETN
ncbi:aminoacylase-1-like [Apostichopus japonicus]|uniref:aminoacylase-1-like n=1 Tax=Stichopus japonicus TaxID=307972 RepID=UPI003AB73E91